MSDLVDLKTIQQLMAGSPDNHVAAMTLLIPWMDRVYKLESGASSKGKTKQVVAHFFPAIDGYELGRLTGFVIDLKHIGYAGKKMRVGGFCQDNQLHGQR